MLQFIVAPDGHADEDRTSGQNISTSYDTWYRRWIIVNIMSSGNIYLLYCHHFMVSDPIAISPCLLYSPESESLSECVTDSVRLSGSRSARSPMTDSRGIPES